MDNTDKFTLKAENYAKYRPSYPSEFIHYLIDQIGIHNSIVADIGAGTGILTKLLAPYVQTIIAIDPNQAMREICVSYCKELKNTVVMEGCAEETGLPDNSVDFITAAQAFHWFDKEKCKVEFKRILNKNGQLILVWSQRIHNNDLIREYEIILKRFYPDFKGLAGGTDTSPDSENDIFLTVNVNTGYLIMIEY